MEKKVLQAQLSNISDGVEFVRSFLKKKKFSNRRIAQTLLTVEEILAKMISSAKEGSDISIEPTGLFGATSIQIKAQCPEFNVSDIYENLKIQDQDEDTEINNAIKKLYNNLFSESLTIKAAKEHTTATISVKKSAYSGLIYTLASLILGTITGFLIQSFLPSDIGKGISSIVFTPIYTMFLNG